MKKNELSQAIDEILSENFPAGAHFLVAASAGGDSTALLHLLRYSTLSLTLTAAYIDHGLRPAEAGREKEWLAAFTAGLDVPFVAADADAGAYAGVKGLSLEDAARRLRYRQLERLRQQVGAEWIVTGHTADDQVETLFIRLIRGCALSGLTAMKWRQGRILRPLLAWPKETLAAYLAERGIRPCHDSSNDDRRFLRNRVRLELLPLLRQRFNSAINTTCLRMMTILEDEEALLEKLTDDALTSMARQEMLDTGLVIKLAIAPFLGLPLALRRRLLNRIAHRLAIEPSSTLIENLLKQCATAVNGAEWHWPWGTRVARQSDFLVFSQPRGRRRWRGRAS
ncbi:MAG: tRNA lysidine(34) synthetase TilS [Desulfobulbaceae bacterium]|jgi:tRNA(Ile)-lysidine synthase|nr:tRNA lysidine(34) synthetase TilS [Desulfobulbaceae bacterium]